MPIRINTVPRCTGSAPVAPAIHTENTTARAIGAIVKCSPCARATRRSCRLLFGLVLAHILDEADDVRGHEPADRAAGVDADDDPPLAVEYESGGLQVPRRVVDERAGGRRDGVGVGVVAD